MEILNTSTGSFEKAQKKTCSKCKGFGASHRDEDRCTLCRGFYALWIAESGGQEPSTSEPMTHNFIKIGE